LAKDTEHLPLGTLSEWAHCNRERKGAQKPGSQHHAHGATIPFLERITDAGSLLVREEAVIYQLEELNWRQVLEQMLGE